MRLISFAEILNTRKVKRIIITVSLLLSISAFAQDNETSTEVLVNKKGNAILPKSGDIGLGFNAVPMLDLALNSLRYVSIMGNSAPAANNVAGNAVNYAYSANQVTGKYFLSDNEAIRIRFGVNTLSGSMVNRVLDAEANYNATLGSADDRDKAANMFVDDELSFSKNNVLIAAGYEMRRGYGRLQGYYGGEIGFGHFSGRERATYGNAFSDEYNVNFTSNFNNGGTTTQSPTDNRVTRDLDVRYGGAISLGLRGFIGVEYFVFPKISVGAEYGFGYNASFQRNTTQEREVYFNGEDGPRTFVEEVNNRRKENQNGFAVDNNNTQIFSLNNTLNGNTALSGGSGAIVILFHF